MAVSAQSILRRVVDQLSDAGNVRWKAAELVRYLNDGQKEVLIYRPDATGTTLPVGLVAGARQMLPANAFKLLDVIRNTGGTKAAVRKIDQKLLDAQLPNWYNAAGQAVIKHYMYDVRDPRVFYVYPPAAASGASLEILYSVYPPAIAEPADGASYTTVTGDITVNDFYSNCLIDYVLFRSFAKDAEFGGNAERAAAHYAAFQNGLGVEASGTAVVSPKE